MHARNDSSPLTRSRRAALARLTAVGTAVLALGSAARGRAQTTLLDVELGAAVPLTSPTADRFGAGGSAGAAVLFSLDRALLLGARGRYVLLSDGPPSSDPSIADPGLGSFSSLAAVLRIRPLELDASGPERGTGLFVEIGGGASLTGTLVRPEVEGAIGWGFALGDVDLAPVVRATQIFHFDDQIDGRGAFVLFAGLDVSFFDGRPRPDVTPLHEPEPVAHDRDADGILDRVDACPSEPEDLDGFQDEDGCPDLDDDEDGVPDASDACRLEPEDRDGFADEDGCPDPDDDGDGIHDAYDGCPRQAEVVNGIEDEDGCPDEGVVTLVDDRIVLDDTVLFPFDRARIRHAAWPILRAIVALARAHPEWSHIRVEGHTDLRGSSEWNQALSERRARNVARALVALGLDRARLESVGFGEAHPRTLGEGEDEHQLNRRVEFVVDAESPAGTPSPSTPASLLAQAPTEP